MNDNPASHVLSRLICFIIGSVLFTFQGSDSAFSDSVLIESYDEMAAHGEYICWTPTKFRARIVVDERPPTLSKGSVLNISSQTTDHGGAIQFQTDSGLRPHRTTFTPKSAIQVKVPESIDGWVYFWVAGRRPSEGTKDTTIVAQLEDGRVVGSLPVMVRVRKNAENLTSFESSLFLDALVRLHDVANESVNSQYTPLVQLHEAADGLPIHGSPLFLPWHRAFLLDLERRLQAIDPRVTIPYWRYDLPSKRIFTRDFMGITEPGEGFYPGEGLGRWIDPRLGGLIRDPSDDPQNGLLNPSIPSLLNNAYVIMRSQIERSFHAAVHNKLGGWLGGPAAPADPIFFLIHANVDRVWAHWQAANDRFSSQNELAYSAQGRYPGVSHDAGQYPPSVYERDETWPWLQGSSSPPWPDLVRPLSPHGKPSPQSHKVTTGGLIDYLDTHGKGFFLGYCYDDIDYFGKHTLE